MRLLLAAALCAAQALHGQLYEVLKSADLDAGLRDLQASTILYRGTGYTVSLESRSAGAVLTDNNASQILSIRSGTGVIRLGLYRHNIGAGDMVRIAHKYGCQLESGHIGFVLLRIPPQPDRKPTTQDPNHSQFVPAVLRASEIAAATETVGDLYQRVEEPTEFPKNFSEGYVSCKTGCLPWHLFKEQARVFFVQAGSAILGLGGQLTNPLPEARSPTLVQGIGADGARSYAAGPGDVVIIPPNTPLYVDRGGRNFSYIQAILF